MQNDKEKKQKEEEIINAISLSTAMKMGINHLAKGNLKKGEIIILITLIGDRLETWIYPNTEPLGTAHKVLLTTSAQVKTQLEMVIAKAEAEKAKRLQDQYIS